MFNRVSAEGFFATPDGKLDWVVPEPEIDKAAAEGLTDSGTIMFGRRTYQMFESFWPHALDDTGTAQDPHGAGRRSPELGAMAKWINNATKLVFSKSLKKVTWKNSRLFHELDPREIETMKKQPGTDIMIFGSGSIVSQLTEHGLIDEYQFVVGPILIGSGKPLFSGVSKSVKLELQEAKKYPSGNVKLRYTRKS
jgi:dihydrofolate reductase